MTILKTTLIGLAATLASLGAAQAADFGPVYGGDFLRSAPELRPVEIGTGWYLRVDASYAFERNYDARVSRASPDFGGTAGSELRLGDDFGAGAGVGYVFSDFLRGDVTARYSRSDVGGALLLGCGGESDCLSLAGSPDSARNWEVMANAYLDLGTFAGFTPYVGGGLGAVRVDYSVPSFDCGPDCTATGSGGEEWRFAYALTGGMSYRVNPSLELDVGYRYLDVEGGRAFDVSAAAPGAQANAFVVDDEGFKRHTVMAGIRYNLW